MSKRDWYRIQNAAGAPARVDIYDEIGAGDLFSQGVSAAGFVADLAGVKGDLEVHINSPGGNVFDGLAIYNAIAQRKGRVTTVVDGLAASAASFIAQAGKTRIVAPGAMLMIHDAHGLTIGNAGDHRETAALLDKASDNVAGLYAAHSGTTAAEWRDAMRQETWYTAQEAVDAGLADKLAERPADEHTLAVAAKAAVRVWAKVPDWVRDQAGDATEPGPEPEALTSAEVTALRALMAELWNWDGPGAMSKAASSDDPAKAYAAICAGRRSGDPDKQSSWALPHHPSPGAAPDPDGVRNALARLPQTDGLTNADAAKAHLQAHLKALGGEPGGTSDHAGMPAWLQHLTAKEAATR